MTYSREKLNSFSGAIFDKSEYEAVVADLVNRVLRNEVISLAEQEFVCGIVKELRPEASMERAFKIDDCQSCKEYNFRRRYLLYGNDLNGHNTVIGFEGEIPFDKKKDDARYLHREYIEWEKFISGKTNGTQIINYVAQETNAQLKILKKKSDKFLIGSRYRDYLKKSLTLHGKYIYLLVKEFYQELGVDSQVIEINGSEVLIDGFTYVHTMFRHYAQGIMSKNQMNKSYHFDNNIGFKSIPNFLSGVLKCYGSLTISTGFNKQNIDFILNGKPYAIFFKPVEKNSKGNIKKQYLRVQTFFPIEEARELKRIEKYTPAASGCGFDFLI